MASAFIDGLQAAQQSTTARLQQKYLGQQITDAEQTRSIAAQNNAASQQAMGFKKAAAGAQAVINSDDPKSTVETLFPEIVQMHEQKFGQGSWQTVTPQQIKQEAAVVRDHSNMQLGVAAPAAMQTIGDTSSPQKGIYQRDPATNKITQITAPQKPDYAPQQMEETARHNRAMESNQGNKAPNGYRAKPDGSLEFIPGGPADPSAKNAAATGLGGRESVMFQRVINSANSATEALKNISDLPVGASTGFIGVGGSPGTGLLSSIKGVLTNKVSGQEVQDYNTMLAGVGRNLATIETAGLAPNGSLTHSMDSIQLREGDTGITKLRKLAEMRQIIIKGIETNTANPKLPKEQKDLVNQIVDQVKTAIPFTQGDITQLQQKQNKNPNYTFKDLMKEKGLGPAAQQPPTGATYQHASGATVEILPQ